MLKNIVASILLISFLFIAFSSTSCKRNRDEIDDIPEENTVKTNKPVINEDQINEIISSFSSPVEMAALMNSFEVPFSKKYIADPAVTEDYDTNVKKALALGILSADLGYLNVYERSSLIVEYLSAIKRISDDLRVSQFFNFQSLKRLATSKDNIDSLLFLSVQSFQGMDSHLRSSGRSNLSLLVITGVWLEGLYLLTQVAKENKNQKLIERIGEQKILFNLLYPIYKIYIDDPYFAKLVDEFKEFQNIFEKINITYQQGDPETKIIDGRVTVIQHDMSIVEISDTQLEQITKTTEKIRNKLLNQ
ncbi:MAG: hypothetical protein U9Q83_06790 [Bacteroidota bacterium]|nr:hypothetical protein [Bacteroidota bacterium]